MLFGDEVLSSVAYGFADLESGTPLRSETLFRIASHSKTFTATAVMQLVERGRLRLDDTLGRWVPWLADSGVGAVTVRELLAHGAGVIRDGLDGDYWQLHRPFPDEADLASLLGGEAATYARNEVFKYSNIGYTLLGLVITAASGRTYGEYVRTAIVDRLGLRRTGPELDPSAGEVATGYTQETLGLARRPIDQVTTGAMAPATGFYGTAEELCRYASAHFLGDERLIGDDAKRLMQREEWVVEGADEHYGLGFEVADLGGRRVIGHGGGWPGHSTKTWFDPVEKLAVSAGINAINTAAGPFAAAAFRLANLASRLPLPESAPSAAELDRYCGRYAGLWGVLDVVRLSTRLYALGPDQPDPSTDAAELTPLGDDAFRVGNSNGFSGHGERMTFELVDGRVRSVRGESAMTFLPVEEYRRTLAGVDRVRIGSPWGAG